MTKSPTLSLDEIDLKIVHAFRVGARLSNSEIAREVEVSEATVRRRLAALAEAGLLRFVAILDPTMLGLSVDTLIGVTADGDKVDAVAEKVASFEEVRYTATSMGSVDIWLSALFPSVDAWGEFRKRLALIDGVQRTETFHVTRVLKRDWDWALPDSWR